MKQIIFIFSGGNMENSNPPSSCIPLLRSSFQELTKAEQKIAEYILENPSDIIHMTISELADASQSAEATIFRFCRKLGFSGYQGLKIALATDLFNPLESVCSEVNPDDDLDVFVSKVFNSIYEGLQDTQKIIDKTALEKAIRILSTTQRIDAYGSGGSAIITADIEHRFMRFGIPVRSYADPHLQIASAALLGPDDVVIAVSHTGSNLDILKAVELAKQNKVTVIAITSYMRSPLSKAADIALHGMSREINYRSEAMASRLAHLAIVDLLYIGVILQNPDKMVENMNKVRMAISNKRM
jgi:RpiR family transcriptional regulator, carbohydrate utilization regulator